MGANTFSRLTVRQGYSAKEDSGTAAADIAEQIGQGDSKLNIIFFTDHYARDEFGHALAARLSGPVIGCSTAGQLGASGYQLSGISGISLAGDCIEAVSYLISPLSTITDQVQSIAANVHQRMEATSWAAFGFLLIDGLSMREEAIAAALYRALGNVPIIGGSAGDMLQFQETFVYHQGRLLRNAAVFTLILTSLPFMTFKHQHFHPTATRLVITEADPEQRIVHEINGIRAVDGYADAISVKVDELDAAMFSRHPLMFKFMDDYYVRSIAGVEPDGSLRFYCAIEKGLVLTVGEGGLHEDALERDIMNIREKIGEPAVILGCDCILRRLEMENLGIAGKIGQLLGRYNIFGFSTYGEQFNSTHVNQTFTGVAIAG